MKYHIALKSLAILLATVFLLTALGSALGIIALIVTDLYELSVDEVYENNMYWERRQLAVNLTHAYASEALGNVPKEYYRQYFGYDWQSEYFAEDQYFYSVFDDRGILVTSTVPEELSDAKFYEIELGRLSYRHMLSQADAGDPQLTVYTDEYYDEDTERYITVFYQEVDLSGYNVHLYLLPGAYVYDAPWQLLQALWAYRYTLFWSFGGGLLLAIAVLIYLCCAAGHKPDTDAVQPGGLNRLPLDLYTACAGILILFLVWLGIYLVRELIYDMTRLLLHLLPVLGALACVSAVGLIIAWAAQLKMANLFWLKNTVVGRVLILIFRVIKWVLTKLRLWLNRLKALTHQLPMLLRRAGTVLGLLLAIPVCIVLANESNHYGAVFWALAVVGILFTFVGMVIYDAYAFGTLLSGAKKMAGGDLDKKINTRMLRGDYYDFADELNRMSDAVAMAAEKHLRSERMKAELVTNVSHDIKTPLTSIINFVDLLQKPHTEEQQQEYLEVLARQSGQMKKLIEDLTELSKATTGNITVNAQKMDAVEAINQALGEFSDKLEAAGLTPVFRSPENPVYITADGRLVWRVLFNLLTNAVKYALPGTRLYVTLTKCEDRVALSLKNVSKEELTATADELLERFVQGDTSRNTEGSGLGLNIARGLMESQQGSLELLLDGDLFKVTLTFPAADN